MTGNLRLGFIGTGIMGTAMAAHLMAAGWELAVYNRTKAKAAPLLERGAHWAASPQEAAEGATAVFSIVGGPADVEEVTLGRMGALRGLAPGGIICDMTTSDPALAERIAAAAGNKGCFALDAPVTGGDTGARAASLSFFVGGSQEAYQRLLPCLRAMGSRITYFGGPGYGQKAKLANQTAVAGIMFSVCEAMLFAQEEGLDVERWLELAAAGGAGGRPMATRGQRILNKDFEPGFFVSHYVKDLNLCLQECRRMGIVLPGTALAEQVYRSMQDQGFGRRGTQSLINWLARFSGRSWHGRAALEQRSQDT